MIYPNFQDFETIYNQDKPQILWTKISADMITPVCAYLHLSQKQPYSFLLESVEQGIRGRYSIIGLKPDIIWKWDGKKTWMNCKGSNQKEDFQPLDQPALESLRNLIKKSQCPLPENLPALCSGLMGHMGYESIGLVEDLPDPKINDLNIPVSLFIRPTVVVCFDSAFDCLFIVAHARPQDGVSARQAYEACHEELNHTLSLLKERNHHQNPINLNQTHHSPISIHRHTCSQDFKNKVIKAKEYILAGDIFQVVLSQRFSLPFSHSPFSFYRALRHINPSPFMFFFNFDDYHVIGASPEILVRLKDEQITIRPIAGTRKRGKNKQEDDFLKNDLLNDPKERAEHLMLLDLGRNDAGKVAKPGSVHVTRREEVELYSHVMHIVSDVCATFDQQKYDAIDALFSGFPAGTVSGAPKIRAMEIIHELESLHRGIYSGAIGCLSSLSSIDTCIALRTAVLKDKTLYIQAGAGIVADSDPESEDQECVNKAKALMKAAEQAYLYDL